MLKRIYMLLGFFTLAIALLPALIFGVEQQDKDAILAELGSFIDKDPDVLRGIIFSMGDSYLQENKLDDVIALYEKALRIFPDDEDFLNRLAALYNQKGNHQKVAEVYKILTELKPENIWYFTKLADVYRDVEDKEKAGELWEGLMQESSDANVFGQAANFYNSEGNLDKAISAMEKAVELEPRNTAYLQSLESFYMRAERFGEAEELCNRVLEISEEAWAKDWVDSELINIYQRQDRLEELAAMFENELAAATGDVRQYKRLAILYQRNNQRDRAIELCEMAVAQGVDDRDINNKLLDLYEWSNELDKAEAQVRKIITIAPQDSHLYERLANILGRAEKKNEAKKAWEQFLEKVPADAGALSRFGDALSGWGDVNGAIGQYRKAQFLDPGNLWYTMHAADLFIREERFREAKKELDKIIADTTDDWIREEAERKNNDIADGQKMAKPKQEPAKEAAVEKEAKPEKKKKRRWWFGR